MPGAPSYGHAASPFLDMPSSSASADKWRAAPSAHNLLYTRCLTAEKKFPFQPTEERTAVVHWAPLGPEQEAFFEKDVATDGSLKHKHRAGGQCGWAVTGMQGGDTVTAWGAMPATLPVQKRILRAELWAILQALRHSQPPVHVHTDCAIVLQLLKKGRKVCTSSRTKHADVWRLIWHCLDDIGLSNDGVSMHKVKAHVTQSKLADMTSKQQHVTQLNRLSDTWAKHGADADNVVRWHVQAVVEQQEKVVEVARFMAYMEVQTRDTNGDRTDVQKVCKRERAKRHLRPPREPRRPVCPHALRYHNGILTCDQCNRKAVCSKGKLRMETEECRGTNAYDRRFGQQAERRAELRHVVWRTGGWTWCHRCGVHSKHKIIGLKVRCKNKFANAQARERRDRLRAGCHPYTGVELGVRPRPLPRKGGVGQAHVDAHEQAHKKQTKRRLRGKQRPVAPHADTPKSVQQSVQHGKRSGVKAFSDAFSARLPEEHRAAWQRRLQLFRGRDDARAMNGGGAMSGEGVMSGGEKRQRDDARGDEPDGHHVHRRVRRKTLSVLTAYACLHRDCMPATTSTTPRSSRGSDEPVL